MTDFEYVLIPVSDPEYLQKGFSFRFYNLASFPDDNKDEFTNFDLWHIDYVKLDKNRNSNDTVQNDVSFVKPISSLLKDYDAIPWDHFRDAYFTQINPFINTSITNLDDISRNVTKYVRIKDLETGYTYKTLPTANDFNKGQIRDFDFEYDYPFEIDPLSPSPSFFEISTIIETDAFDYKNNDTLRRVQVFDDYYALDDGSSEYGYGLSDGGTTNALVAVKFTSFKADSLRAVDMYFNQIDDSLNLNFYFTLSIWDDNNGKPGNLLYGQEGERPTYSQELNQFIRYPLDSTLWIEGDFYVGWKKTVNKLSNIGFDLNKDNKARNFYNLGPEWKQSQAQGTIMIRPVFSSLPLSTYIKTEFSDPEFRIYPNPADQFINVEWFEPVTNPEITIFDIYGRTILRYNTFDGDAINTAELPDGIYLLSVYFREMNLRLNKKFFVRH